MSARQFGRDGDTYGRHALSEPGGNERQRDVFHVLTYTLTRGLHPTRIRPEYVGRHRESDR